MSIHETEKREKQLRVMANLTRVVAGTPLTQEKEIVWSTSKEDSQFSDLSFRAFQANPADLPAIIKALQELQDWLGNDNFKLLCPTHGWVGTKLDGLRGTDLRCTIQDEPGESCGLTCSWEVIREGERLE